MHINLSIDNAYCLKEYAYKDYLSFQKKEVGETNILQQTLWKSVDRFCRYDHVYIIQCLTMGSAILFILSRDQNHNILIYRIWFGFCTLNQFKLITLYKRNAYKPFTYISFHSNGCYFNFCNSEVMTSFPHNLVLSSQPCFGATLSRFLNLYNFLINEWIFMNLVAKCSAFVTLSY